MGGVCLGTLHVVHEEYSGRLRVVHAKHAVAGWAPTGNPDNRCCMAGVRERHVCPKQQEAHRQVAAPAAQRADTLAPPEPAVPPMAPGLHCGVLILWVGFLTRIARCKYTSIGVRAGVLLFRTGHGTDPSCPVFSLRSATMGSACKLPHGVGMQTAPCPWSEEAPAFGNLGEFMLHANLLNLLNWGCIHFAPDIRVAVRGTMNGLRTKGGDSEGQEDKVPRGEEWG